MQIGYQAAIRDLQAQEYQVGKHFSSRIATTTCRNTGCKLRASNFYLDGQRYCRQHFKGSSTTNNIINLDFNACQLLSELSCKKQLQGWAKATIITLDSIRDWHDKFQNQLRETLRVTLQGVNQEVYRLANRVIEAKKKFCYEESDDSLAAICRLKLAYQLKKKYTLRLKQRLQEDTQKRLQTRLTQTWRQAEFMRQELQVIHTAINSLFNLQFQDITTSSKSQTDQLQNLLANKARVDAIQAKIFTVLGLEKFNQLNSQILEGNSFDKFQLKNKGISGKDLVHYLENQRFKNIIKIDLCPILIRQQLNWRIGGSNIIETQVALIEIDLSTYKYYKTTTKLEEQGQQLSIKLIGQT